MKRVRDGKVASEHLYFDQFFAGGKQVAREGGVCTLVELPSIYQCNATNWFTRAS